MADADEDLIPSLDHSRLSQDGDFSDSGSDSDAAPDYRFLSNTTVAKKHALPSRGTKDFEPNPTARQASTLDASRKAMTDALGVIRVHTSRRNENIGVYFSNPADWDGQRYEEAALGQIEDETKRARTKDSSTLKKGEGRCVVVEKFSTTFSRTMGCSDRRNWTWLLPEEALFLLERGSLDLRYAEDEDESDEKFDAENTDSHHTAEELDKHEKNSRDTTPCLKLGEVPMSLQGAYAAFVGPNGLTLERYLVYANLRRVGYIVQRAPTWHGPVDSVQTMPDMDQPLNARSENLNSVYEAPSLPHSTSLVHRLFSWLFRPALKPSAVPCFNSAIGPLVSPGLFRTYADIFRQIHLIPQHSTKLRPLISSTPFSNANSTYPSAAECSEFLDPPLVPTFHLHKPSALASYRKSAPPLPHQYVVVLDSRTSTIPTSTQIGNLLASLPDDDLPGAERKRLETRIKHGKRSVLLGVVDSGLISYLRFSGGGFEAGDWLWEEADRRRGRKSGGSKGRGRGGYRGRGRARGRGA